MSDYTYLYKMNKLIYIGILLLPGLLFTTGCSQEEMRGQTDGTDVEDGSFVPVAFSIDPEPLQVIMDMETEGESLLSTKVGNEDATINNLTVLQFNWDKETEGGDGATTQCVTSRYLRAPEPEDGTVNVYSIGLRAQTTQKQHLIFLANAGPIFQQYEGKTLADFRKETVALDQKTTSGDNVLMIGAVDVPVVSEVNTTPYGLTLKRLVACVHFSWTAKPTVTNTTFTPSVLQLKNVPKVLKYIDGVETAAADYPEKAAGNFKNYTPIVDRIDDGFTWYIPLNRRAGKGTAATSWEKTGEKAPDNYCTYIELAGVYRTPNMPDQLATYRFYIGENQTDDYNVYQNHTYEVKAEITGVNTFDKRVTRKNFSYYQSANSFLIAPVKDNELSFSPYTAPGIDVNGTGIIYKAQLIEDRYSKISDVKLIWQTSDNLVSVSHGQGMIYVKPNEQGISGNALIGAYDEEGNVIWSWHIWVTDYAGIINDNETNVLVGTRQTYNNLEWMDRNLGALNTLTPAVPELMFQWGRKDPFLKDNMYTANGSSFSFSTVTSPVDPFLSSIKAPATFYKVTSAGAWYGDPGEIEDLWQDNAKTVFDPCPYGWRIPKNGSWNGFKQNVNFFTWYYDRYSEYLTGIGEKAIYRLGGRIQYNDGSLQPLRTYGYLWSSTLSEGSDNAYSLYYESKSASGNLSNGVVDPNRLQSKAYGLSVRCVKIK